MQNKHDFQALGIEPASLCEQFCFTAATEPHQADPSAQAEDSEEET
jgi:hypothetical protein